MNAAMLTEVLKLHEAGILEALAVLVRPAPDDMLTTAELAVRLKTTARTIEDWRRDGRVIPVKVDKVLLFYWPLVVAQLLQNHLERPEGTTGPQDNRTKGPQPALLSASVLRPSPLLPAGHPLPSDGRGASAQSGAGLTRKGDSATTKRTK